MSDAIPINLLYHASIPSQGCRHYRGVSRMDTQDLGGGQEHCQAMRQVLDALGAWCSEKSRKKHAIATRILSKMDGQTVTQLLLLPS